MEKEKKAAEEKADALSKDALFVAASFIARKGYEILETGWECPAGQIGIIAFDDEDGTLAFIEVKGRKDSDEGLPDGNLMERERARMEGVASYYLATPGIKVPTNVRVRFDVVAVLIIPPDRALISHHTDVLGNGPINPTREGWGWAMAAIAGGSKAVAARLAEAGEGAGAYLRGLVLADLGVEE